MTSTLSRLLNLGLVLALIASIWQMQIVNQGTAIGPDAGYYLMLAKRIISGAVPYLDFNILHPAGAFYQQAVLISLFGSTVEMIKLQLLFYYFTIAILVVLTLKIAFKASLISILISLIFYFSLLPTLEAFQFVIEPISGFWGWCAILLAFVIRSKQEPQTILMLLCGLFVGMATMQKQIGVLYVFPTLFLLFANKNRKNFLSPAIIYSAAFITPLAVFFALYPQAFLPFFEQNFIKLFAYAKGSYVPSDTTYFSNLIKLQRQLIFIAVPVITLILSFNKNIANSYQKNWTPIVFALSSILFSLPIITRPYLHYYLFPLPFLVFCLGYLVNYLPSLSRTSRLIISCLLLFSLHNSSCWQKRPWLIQKAQLEVNDRVKFDLIAEWIKTRAINNDKIIILPDSPELYFLSGKEAATNNYEFYPDQAVFTAAATGEHPTFTLDRGHLLMNKYEEDLRKLGLEKVDVIGKVAYWKRKE